MPFESSLPLVFVFVALAVIAVFAWLKTQARPWLAIAILAACTALAVFVADRLVETDREHIEALFPRLAAAAERQDIDTILAALDPELRPLRADAERVLKQVRPTEITITKLDVSLDSPEAANVDMIVRVSGNVIDERTPGTTIAGLRVSMTKKGGQWLVADVEVRDPVRAGP
jgi:hypothetical protein